MPTANSRSTDAYGEEWAGATLVEAVTRQTHHLQGPGRHWHPVLPRVIRPFHRNAPLSGLQVDVGSTPRRSVVG